MMQAFNRKESYGNERRQESICPGALTVQLDVGATIRLVLRGSHAFDRLYTARRNESQGECPFELSQGRALYTHSAFPLKFDVACSTR
jgi:hypothetical protein